VTVTAREKIIEAIRDFDWSNVDPHSDLGEWVPNLADAICSAIDDQPFHVLDVTDTGWTLKHPLDCRDELFECPHNRAAEALEGPPAKPGRYRVSTDGRGHIVIESAA
jgi:hypothetical protein